MPKDEHFKAGQLEVSLFLYKTNAYRQSARELLK
jgi:hypothetical protein